MQIIEVGHRSTSSKYVIRIGSGMLDAVGSCASETCGAAKKAAIISNPSLFGLYGQAVIRSLRSSGFSTSAWLMKDGERYKDLASLKGALAHLSAEQISRNDVVIALGGGVVGDLAGFAAAVYLRGIRFLQVPTTLLAMIDSSVGGKTGINTEFGKNLVGAFHRPAGVLIDVHSLNTLPGRELTAGFCEAIKHGAISGQKLLIETADYVAVSRDNGITTGEKLVKLIADQVNFKASIVKQDERESTGRDDSRSRKILNFGHTFAHALEKITKYKRLRHGEAVGYGIKLAARLSKNLDLLPQNELDLLNDVVHRAGRLPGIADIDSDKVFEAFKYDKKSTGEGLKWVLLKGIGHPVIVPEKDIPRRALTNAVNETLKS